MGNFAENLNLGNRFRRPPPLSTVSYNVAPSGYEMYFRVEQE